MFKMKQQQIKKGSSPVVMLSQLIKLPSISNSKMRLGVIKSSKSYTSSDEKETHIRGLRGAFRFLPVRCSNDLVHGSWWMVWGSLLSTLIPIIPLLDIYVKIFHTREATILYEFSKASTWILCIVSGVFFTVGSWVYIRAFEVPEPTPLLHNFYHFSSDELLASWLFLFAVFPAVPYSLLYLIPYPYHVMYVGSFIASLLFVAGSSFFVYACYPNSQVLGGETHIIEPFVRRVCGNHTFLLKHVSSDWLAACWFICIATFICAIGSYLLIFSATNDRQVFVYTSGFVDCLLFLIGSMYYVAGSYCETTDLSDAHSDNFIKGMIQF